MWSDTIREEELRKAIDALWSVLPKPRGDRDSVSLPIASSASPEQVAHQFHSESGFIWLDGNDTRHFLCRDPIARLICDGERATVQGPAGVVEFPIASFDALGAALRAWQGADAAMLVGFLGYDLVAELENVGPIPSPSAGFPRLCFGLYDFVLVHDAAGWSFNGTNAWRDLTSKVAETRDVLEHAATPALPDPEIPEVELKSDDEAFVQGVRNLVERIHQGDFFQTNLCRTLTAEFPAPAAWSLYRRMRKGNPAQYGAFLNLDPQTRILSMSPELFLRVENHVVESRPIKGTRKRERDNQQDKALRADLLSNTKDGAELAMIVDVTRNDLSRVCEAGSVRVLEHRSLLTLPSLHHTYSRIEGRLKTGAGIADLLRASFPPASITGAPKIAAVQAALQEERQGRGPCMGGIGWISMGGELEFSVAIRTAWIHGGKLRYLAGCGITAESIPLQELAESQAKAASFVAAISGNRTTITC